MRFHSASILGVSALLFAISADLPFAHAERQLLRDPTSSGCVIQAVVKLAIDPEKETGDEVSFECEIDPSDTENNISGLSFPIELDDQQKNELKGKLDSGELVSDETTLLFESGGPAGIQLGNGVVHVPPGIKIALGKRNNKRSRRLTSVTGIKPILVVKVTDSDGKKRNESPAQISDDIFGTNGDPVNLKSQMGGCSFGQLDIIAGDPPTNSAGANEVAAGVIEVSISIPLSGNTRGTIRNAVTTAAQNKLGFGLPGPYQQVMYILEGCHHTDCGWAAYAYINSWNSVYQGPYYYMTAVQMHELGHNFGFAHSGGLNGATYTDHTCLMGNPLYSDDVGKMCFNGAKNWQIGWYENNEFIFDQQGSWSGRMVGIADYNNNPGNHPVVIKLETGTSTDQFIAFNRATGVNSQNDEADNEVTIVQTGNNGEAYSQSYLLQHLVQGESYQISNWRGSGQTLTITAETIDIGANPGYADISICLGPCASPTASPTSSPTTTPSASPTKTPTVSPSAAPTKAPTTDAPTASPSASPTETPTVSPTTAPTKAPTTGTPTASPTASPTTTPSASPTKTPTVSPTAAPTKAPTTDAPTASPSASPTKTPTVSPTAAPTKAPTTDAPTTSPSVSPTKSPTTSPTAGPTVSPTTGAPTTSPTAGPTGTPTAFSCSNITRARPCRRTAGCLWRRGKCITQPVGTCSATNCSACTKRKKCRNVGCTWKRGTCS